MLLNDLPEDILHLIWQKYYSTFVMDDFMKNLDFVWRNPSERLIMLCQDNGTIQQGHSCLEDMIEDENMWVWRICTNNKCLNCKHHGFPCLNLASYGFENEKLKLLWKPNFIN